MRAYHDLVAAVHGDVIAAGSPAFDDAVRGHNPALQHDPAIVVVADDQMDVSRAVTVARRHGLSVQPQATGHGPSRLITGGILLRTHRLNAIDIDASQRVARVGAGAIWGDLLDACSPLGLYPPGMASVASVGVGGYLLGGGMGPLARRDGFGSDHMVAVELVDAAGRIATVDADHEADLFSACRGGRLVPAVLTAVTIRLAPAPPLFAATLTYQRADIADALTAYASWQRTLGDETTTVATVFRFPDVPALPPHLRGQRFLQLDLVHAGDEQSGRAQLERFTAAAQPHTQVGTVTDPASWLRTRPPVPSQPTWQRGLALSELTPEIVESLVAVAGPETDTPWRVVELRPIGGALGRPPATLDSVGGRSQGALVSVVATASDRIGAHDAAYAQLRHGLGRAVGSELNVNFHGLESPDHPIRNCFPPDTWRRLTKLWATQDPTGVFHTPDA